LLAGIDPAAYRPTRNALGDTSGNALSPLMRMADRLR
jgi:hypothetical protein